MSNYLNHQNHTDESWMTSYEAQVYLQVSRRTLFRWCKTKKLPYTMIGGTRYYPKRMIAWLMRQRLNNVPFK